MKEEPFFGKNINEALKRIKGLFKKEEEILNCPFCYSELKITDTMYKLREDGDTFEFCVKCPNCKCNGPFADDYTEALKLWNDRSE